MAQAEASMGTSGTEQEGKAPDGMFRYAAELEPQTSGSLVYGVRVVPTHGGLASPYEMGLARWA
jgi:hypothetical protein